MIASVRLRQVVVITSDLAKTIEQVESRLGLRDPFCDPGVAEFGLENRVYAVGDCFLEVLTPVHDDTAGGRYLKRRGGDAGYMAIFQVQDLEGARTRVADRGIRVVWQADLPDIAGTHLHPVDVPGAIVSLDRPDPAESWRWGGPNWIGGAPAGAAGTGGIAALTVAAVDPEGTASRWADVLGPGASRRGTDVELPEAEQLLQFVAVADARAEGIVGCGLEFPSRARGEVGLAGVQFAMS